MIRIPKAFKEELIAHSLKESPNEACGILAGRGGRVEKIYKMANAEKSALSFLMEPKEQFKAMKEMRESNLEMLAIYHSHPETPARPSARDIELAYYPDSSYVIISLKDKGNPDIRSFKIRDGEVAEEELGIE